MQSAVCNRCPLWARCCLNYDGKACHKAAKEAGFEVKPTNFERIKDMSVEELAELLDSFRACNNCMKNGNSCFPSFNTMEWLERGVDE